MRNRIQERRLAAATAIRLDPDKTEAAFLARQLVQATLPHRDPGDVPAWFRTNGNLTLTIQSGYKDKQAIGYPYGTIPRLLLFWITTEAIRTKNPRLDLGKDFACFMRALGLNPGTGRGKRGDAKRLKEQMERLFNAKISFEQNYEQDGKKGHAWMNMDVAPEGMLWWDEEPNQDASRESWIQLGEKFFAAIVNSPVPVDMRALKALKNSPLALDLYTWVTYTAYRTQQNGQARSVSWQALHSQFGSDYHDIKDFKKYAKKALRKIQAVYPELGIEYVRGGVMVLPCNPAVTIKTNKGQDGQCDG